MPIIRYKRKRLLKIRRRITNQIISHDSRGYTVINEDYISYRYHLYIFKVVIRYFQGFNFSGFLPSFELKTSPEITWL